MIEAPNEHSSSDRAPTFTCSSCARVLDGKVSFSLRGPKAWLSKCARCSLLDTGLLLRSTKVALIVGSALVALNQGGPLLSGSFPWTSAWYKIVLTYLVPFGVATYGALANGYVEPKKES